MKTEAGKNAEIWNDITNCFNLPFFVRDGGIFGFAQERVDGVFLFVAEVASVTTVVLHKRVMGVTNRTKTLLCPLLARLVHVSANHIKQNYTKPKQFYRCPPVTTGSTVGEPPVVMQKVRLPPQCCTNGLWLAGHHYSLIHEKNTINWIPSVFFSLFLG